MQQWQPALYSSRRYARVDNHKGQMYRSFRVEVDTSGRINVLIEDMQQVLFKRAKNAMESIHQHLLIVCHLLVQVGLMYK